MLLNIKRIRTVKLPTIAYSDDSWIDFFIPTWLWFISLINSKWNKEAIIAQDWVFEIPWHWRVVIPMWINIELEKWFDLTLMNKSWIATKKWLILWAHLIDNWYRWELLVNLINTNPYPVLITEWTKIVQWVVSRVEEKEIIEINELSSTDRWSNWFGSTWLT
jgi:dUTPase